MRQLTSAFVASFSPLTSIASALALVLSAFALDALAQQSTPTATPGTSTAADQRPEYYVVKKGDSLSGIAMRYGIPTAQLAEWNAISNPTRIQVGQRLRLTPPDSRPKSTVANIPVVVPPPCADCAPAKAPEVSEQGTKAGRDEDLRAITSDLIVLLLQHGVITRQKADALMKRAQLGPLPADIEEPVAQQRPPPPTAQVAPTAAVAVDAAHGSQQVVTGPKPEVEPLEPGEVAVPYIPQVVQNRIREQLKEEVMAQAKTERWAEPSAYPEWLDRLGLYGDFRLRYQGNGYGPGNVPAPIYNGITGSDQTNTTQDESQFYYRARLGMNAKISETVAADFRITTGNADNPVSTNQQLGDYFNRSIIELDRAYLGWNPNQRWTVLGGRTPNPFVSTNMVWDEDVNFDGFSGTYKPRFGPAWNGFLTGGAYVVQLARPNEVSPDPKIKYLLGVQGGTEFNLGTKTRMKVALAYYDYKNIEGVPNPSPGSQANDWTAPLFKQKGNSLFNINSAANPANPIYALAPNYGILDLNASADLFHFDPIVVGIYGDFARNLAFDASEIQSRTGLTLSPDINAYKIGLTVGKPALAAWGDWQAFFNYRYIQGDAVLDAFNDNNFHLGGTNAKGYEIGAAFSLHRNLSIRARWFSADQISGPPLAIDVFQFDIDARF